MQQKGQQTTANIIKNERNENKNKKHLRFISLLTLLLADYLYLFYFISIKNNKLSFKLCVNRQ